MICPRLETIIADAWRPPRRYAPSEWAEQNRVLPAGVSAEPGRYRIDRTPYARGIMDAVAEVGVEEIWICAGTQIGKSTIQENILGYWIDNDPGPCLIVRPTEQSVEESIRERWRPLLESCPSLRRHLSARREDNSLAWIRLDTMPIYFGWSGSPQSLASRPCRYVLLDETDKFVPFSGREADPISLARERSATYGHRRRLIGCSTPTVRDGFIWRQFEACGDRRFFHVPCPHCGRFQRLIWSGVRWPKLPQPDKIRLADEIERARLAWYECQHCRGRIDDSHKPKMLQAGKWISEGSQSRRVGFHLSSLYSPWRSFAEMAAEWIRADGDIALTMNFRNSRLAEPFEVQISTTDAETIRAKAKLAGPPEIVPDFAIHLFATADVQRDRIYFVIRAWGYGFRSALVRYGVVLGFDELWNAVFGQPCRLSSGAAVTPEVLMVDCMYRSAEVLEFQKRDAARILRSVGLSSYNAPLATLAVEQGGLPILRINTLLSKDRLDQMLRDGDATRWLPHCQVDDDYAAQLSSEHRVWDQKARREVWKTKTGGRANHYWDCEANQCALAAHRHLDIPAPAAAADGTEESSQRQGWIASWKQRY